MPLIIYPAIDLRGGKVVRLRHGDPAQQTTYSDDPVATARRWKQAGAEWLHVVNLNGALGETSQNLALLPEITGLGLKIQFGGGLRSLEDAARALDRGAARIVLGTLAVQQPAQAGEAVQRFGAEPVVVALDARDGMVSTHGWQAQSAWSPAELGRRFASMGVQHALFTDISRDGDLRGVNVDATEALARETGLQVIASGGVASLDEVRVLVKSRHIAGVVIGRALYTGDIRLKDALAAAREEPVHDDPALHP